MKDMLCIDNDNTKLELLNLLLMPLGAHVEKHFGPYDEHPFDDIWHWDAIDDDQHLLLFQVDQYSYYNLMVTKTLDMMVGIMMGASNFKFFDVGLGRIFEKRNGMHMPHYRAVVNPYVGSKSIEEMLIRKDFLDGNAA